MKVVGIVAEYNPFHNGHKYHIQKAKELSGASHCIVVISGNFVQRGTPAIIDKYSRAKMALQNGADLVLELPCYYATSSAENFAAGAIALLDRLGVVNSVCFGSECGDIEILNRFAHILSEESTAFSETLRQNLKDGLSFPVARNNALNAVYPDLTAHTDVLSSPNNILAIEYLKALRSRKSVIKPLTVQRLGSGYHDKRMALYNSSALAIRQALEQRDNLLLIANQVPPDTFRIMEEHFHVNYPIYAEDLSLSLHYKLLQEYENGYTRFVDVSEDLSDKIKKNLEQFTGFPAFCDLLKSKDMTYTRISRLLLHILLDNKKEAMQRFLQEDYVYYGRILGLKQSSTDVLSEIKLKGTIPLLSKMADAEQVLENVAYKDSAMEMLRNDIFAAHVYDSLASNKFHTYLPNEYRRQIVKVR